MHKLLYIALFTILLTSCSQKNLPKKSPDLPVVGETTPPPTQKETPSKQESPAEDTSQTEDVSTPDTPKKVSEEPAQKTSQVEDVAIQEETKIEVVIPVKSDQELALEAFYQSLHGEKWKDSGLWKDPQVSFCSWYGIYCDNDNNVLEVNLEANDLEGEIPSEITLLKKLEKLNLSYNKISGKIPTEMTTLKNLAILNLSNNQINGIIPSEFVSFKSLTHLNLSHNQIIPPIPQKIYDLPYLSEIDLSHNRVVRGPRETTRGRSTRSVRLTKKTFED